MSDASDMSSGVRCEVCGDVVGSAQALQAHVQEKHARRRGPSVVRMTEGGPVEDEIQSTSKMWME